MKSLYVILGLLLVSNIAFAQNYKPFRVILGLGYATGSGYASGGLLGTLEPGYRLSDRFALGLRGEVAGIARGSFEGMSVDVDVSSLSSVTLNSVYYFKGEARPFVGAGFGRYALSGFGYNVSGSGAEEKRGREVVFGFYPRAGIELGHLGFTIDYNVLPRTKLRNGTEFKNSYLGIRVSVFFGGGKIRKASY